MHLSVIIPALDEESRIVATVEAAAAIHPFEIIVVDGGSRDRTATVAARPGVHVVSSARGRARQMNAGAHTATGDVLLFLHADARLPTSAARDVATALDNPRVVGGRFDVRLDGSAPIYRVIETLMNARSRLTRIATGDQAIFVRRRVFDDLGGYASIPLMEDIEFSSRLKRAGRIACLHSRVLASSRRWQQRGPGRTIALMWALRALYAAGVSPQRLARAYASVR